MTRASMKKRSSIGLNGANPGRTNTPSPGSVSRESARQPAPSVRERLIAAASELFYAQGLHAVGIDAVIAKAGVAKMSLYNHFGSKDELIAEVLRVRHDEMALSVRSRATAIAHAASLPDPSGLVPTPQNLALIELAGVYDAMAEWLERSGVRGCPFLNALAELADPSHPGRAVVRAYCDGMNGLFRGLAERAGVIDHQSVGEQCLMLLQGAICRSCATGSVLPLSVAREGARALVKIGVGS